jgi:penicillin V acylase-like amidase (Ntn superfamily)
MRRIFAKSVSAISILLTIALSASPCTRAVYLGENGQVITVRSMDWKVDVGTNLWVFPRGIQRSGVGGPHSLKWTSRYGSVIASGYDVSSTDGLNEKGLAANLLWLVESKYPQPKSDTPTLSISIWAQYVLDNFATVAEAVKELETEPFIVVTDKVPGEDRLATLHLSMSDATGDSAIVEYVNGKQVIHHDRKYQVMTNSPTYDEQLAVERYWRGIGGTTFLPGTNRAADRFARASFYINAIPKGSSPDVAVASAFSVIRNASVPFGLNTEDEPNISSTRWRTVVDHKRLLYFFESALTPNTFWVNLHDLQMSAGSPVLKLELGKNQNHTYAGNAASAFRPAPSFKFLGL